MSKLFTPIKIAGVELKNRIVMSPMCMYSCGHDGKATDFHKFHYTTRAIGRAALIMTEATAVSPQGRISENDLGIWSDEHIAGHRGLTELVHSHGAKMGTQLAHAGRKSLTSGEILAPTAIPFDNVSKMPKEMTHDDIEEVKKQFINAAKRAKKAGYDIVEIHGAHGYLINEFLSSLTNKRKDKYGSDLDGRAKLLYEIVEGIKDKVDIPLFVRLSAMEYKEGGFNIEENIEVVKRLEKLGVELIDVSSGGNQPDVDMKPHIGPLYQVPLAERIKHEAGIKVGAVGLITTAQEAESVLAQDKADLVLMGRELLRNPYFPMQAQVTLGHKPLDVEIAYKRAFL